MICVDILSTERMKKRDKIGNKNSDFIRSYVTFNVFTQTPISECMEMEILQGQIQQYGDDAVSV